jgi:hypothetical protein
MSVGVITGSPAVGEGIKQYLLMKLLCPALDAGLFCVLGAGPAVRFFMQVVMPFQLKSLISDPKFR